MDDRLHARAYLLQCLILGMPAGVAGGGMALLVGWQFVVRQDMVRGPEGAVMFLWAAAGMVGLVAWLWLSVRYVSAGRASLLRSQPPLWWCMALGCLAALGVLALVLYSLSVGSPWQVLGYALLGPPILLPAAHLAWLRFGPRRQPALEQRGDLR